MTTACSSFKTDLQVDNNMECRVRQDYQDGKGEQYDQLFNKLQAGGSDNTTKVNDYLNNLQDKKKVLEKQLHSKHTMLSLKKELVAQTNLQIERQKRAVYIITVLNILVAGAIIGTVLIS